MESSATPETFENNSAADSEFQQDKTLQSATSPENEREIHDRSSGLDETIDNEVGEDTDVASDSLHLSVINNIEKWSSVNLDEHRSQMDQQAIELTERKEDYLSRRKILSTKIKELQKCISGDTAFDVETYRKTGKNLIDTFKTEFDHLAKGSKLTEEAFLFTYHLIRDVPDPYLLFKQVLMWYDLSQDEIVSLKDDLRRLVTLNANNEQKKIDDKNLIELKQEVRESFENEILAERARLEEDFRKRETSIRSHYENRMEDVQQYFQSLMSAKDSELASVSTALQHALQKSSEYAEREQTIFEQISRQQIMEEKLSNLTADLSESRSKLNENEREREYLSRQLSNAEVLLASDSLKRSELIETNSRALNTLQMKISRLESELNSLPPLDLSTFAVKIGMPIDKFNIDYGEPCSGILWSQVESFIVETMRDASSTAVTLRAKENDLQSSLKNAMVKTTDLSDKLKKREGIIESLEKDLKVAQLSLEKVQLSMHNHDPFDNISNNRDRIFEDAASDKAIATVGASIIQTVQGQRDRLGQLAQEHEKDAIALRQSLVRSQEEVKELQDENVELFKRLRLLRMSSADTSGGNIRGSSQSNMGVDSRGNVIKPRYSRKKIGAWNYSNDNSAEQSQSNYSVLNKGDHDEENDALEGRYLKLYESQLDPFKVEELDRQIIMSKLNFIDWSLAVVSRTMLRDQWTRFILVLYLFLVHVFASGYVIQVLNPEIISEMEGGRSFMETDPIGP